MMGRVRPIMSMVTLQDVDHEDEMIEANPEATFLGSIFGESPESMKRPQGVSAGVIIEVGATVEDSVPDLKPGFKVYYRSGYALKINDVWVLDFRAMLAYEEL